MGREGERGVWGCKRVEEYQLWRKERLESEKPWPGGIFRRLERGGRAVHRPACYPATAESEALALLSISSGCGENVLCPQYHQRSIRLRCRQPAVTSLGIVQQRDSSMLQRHFCWLLLTLTTNTRKQGFLLIAVAAEF